MLFWLVVIAIVLLVLLFIVKNPTGPITGPDLGYIAGAENLLTLLLLIDVIIIVIILIVRWLS